MMKQRLSTISIALFAAAVATQAGAAVPTIDEIAGSYIQCDSTRTQDETTGTVQTMWNNCTDLSISKVDGADDKVAISGFWRQLRGKRFTLEADFDDFNGQISMPAGTVVWVDNRYDINGQLIGSAEVKAYAMEGSDEEGWSVSTRPILFNYDQSTGRYSNNGYIVIATTVDDEEGNPEEAPMQYMYNVTLIPANGKVVNESYRVESDGSVTRYGEESRACYVDEVSGTILNLLYTDQYGSGPLMKFRIEGDRLVIPAAAIASLTDVTYSYKVLAGVDIDPETYVPSLTPDMEISGSIVTADNNEKTVSLSPSAIYAAEFDSKNYTLYFDDDSPIYEVVERLELTYTPDKTAGVGNVVAVGGCEAKVVAKVEYFDLYGRILPNDDNSAAGIVIKKTTYTDGTVEAVKTVH